MGEGVQINRGRRRGVSFPGRGILGARGVGVRCRAKTVNQSSRGWLGVLLPGDGAEPELRRHLKTPRQTKVNLLSRYTKDCWTAHHMSAYIRHILHVEARAGGGI